MLSLIISEVHLLFSLTLILIIVLIISIVYSFNLKRKLKSLTLESNIFSELQNSSNNVVIKYHLQPHWHLSFISENIEKYTGYSQHDLIRNNILFRNLINKADLKIFDEKINSLRTDKKDYKIDYRIKTPGGEERWVQESGIGVFNKKHQLVEIHGVIKDIHSSKLSEIFLSENENRFEKLIENTPFGTCIICDDLITYCNPSFLKMLGYPSKSEVIGTSLQKYIRAREREKLKQLITKLQRPVTLSINEEIVKELEITGVCKNRAEKYFQMYFSKMSFGDLVSVIVFVQDITERKRNEELLYTFNKRLENIIELIPDPTFIIDNDRKVTHWNIAIEELTGVRKTEIIGKSNYSDIFYDIKRPMLIDLAIDDSNITTCYKNLKKINNRLFGEYAGPIRKDRKKVYLWGVASPLYDKNENLFGAIELIKDVTEHREKEVALFESEEKARIILDCNQDSIILIEPEGTIVDCNTSAAQKIGVEKNSILNSNYLNFLPPSKRIEREMQIAKIKETGKELILEEFFPPDNEYYLTSMYPVKGRLNIVQRIVISLKNISRIKQAEIEIKAKEEYYRTITENITDYIYKIHYKKGNVSIEFTSSGVDKVIGYKTSELITSQMIFDKLFPPEMKRKALIILKQIIKYKRNRTIEHQIIHKTGQVKWLSNSIIFKDSCEIIGVVKDITLQKHLEKALLEAEERYRTVFDQSGLASLVFDLSGKLIMQNPLAAEIMGGMPSNFIGRNIEGLFPAKVATYVRESIKETILKGGVCRETEFEVLNKKIWLRTFTHTIKNVNGEVIGVQFISQNITEKKEMEKKVLNVILETEEKERKNFAQELHDGVGPLLSTIKMYVQWLGMPVVNVSRSEILADIAKTVDESLVTVREISYRLNPGNLIKLGLTAALKEFAEKINKTGKININIRSNLDKRFEVRKETILYRVLCESINNTLKYANASEVEIQINYIFDKLKVKYTDDGVGFDLESVTKQNKGSGIKNIKNRLKSIGAFVLFNTEPGNGVEMIIETII